MRQPGLHPAVACGLLAATLDLTLAGAWWAAEGVPPVRVLQAVAEWAIGARAYGMGMASAAFGVVFYAALMCVLAALYRGLSRGFPVLLRHAVACGAAYGLAMYLLLFGAILPALVGRPLFGPQAWMAACMLAYMFLIGVPCALFARVPAGSPQGPRRGAAALLRLHAAKPGC